MDTLLDALADGTRRRLLALIADHGELCVCELAAAIDEVQPKVSRHLAVLRDAGWLATRREGTWIHYRLRPLPPWAQAIAQALIEGGVPPKDLDASVRRLRRFPGRPLRALEQR